MSTYRNRRVKTFKPSEPRVRHFMANPGEDRSYNIKLVSQLGSNAQYPDQHVTTTVRNGWAHTDWLQDVVVYGYRQRSKAGEVFNNPMVRFTEKWSQTPGSWSQRAAPTLMWYNSKGEVTYRNAERNGSGFWYDPSILRNTKAINPKALANECSDMLERAKTVAITEAAADIESTDLAALVSIKELPETVAWFISIFTRAIGIKRNLIKNLKKFERKLKRNDGSLSAKQVKEIYRSMEDLRMEYRYAVRPILADMEGIAKFFHNPKAISPRITARGYNRFSESRTRKFDFVVPESVHMKSTACTATVHEQYDVNVRAGFLCQVELDEVSSLWHRVGFNQSFSAMWQMLPLSFVIDWFINLGALLAALEPKAGSKILAGWVTVEEQYTYRLTGNGSSNHTSNITKDGVTKQNVVNTRLSGLSREMEFTRKTRVPVTLGDVGLRLDINLNFSKILDLITIARNLR